MAGVSGGYLRAVTLCGVSIGGAIALIIAGRRRGHRDTATHRRGREQIGGSVMPGDEVKFHVEVKVLAAGSENFRLSFDFGEDPNQGVAVRCSRNLSETDAQRLENLATNFVANIADIIVKLQ